MFTSPKRLWLTDDGQVVEEGDPRARRLLVGEGGQLPRAQAVQYGLIPEGEGAVPVLTNAPPPNDAAPPADADEDDVIQWDAPADPEDAPPNDAAPIVGKQVRGPQANKAQRGPQGTK